jgi:hypothetical protein
MTLLRARGHMMMLSGGFCIEFDYVIVRPA